MAWEPKDPWGRSGDDPLDEALKKAQEQLNRLVPGRGFKPVIGIVVLILVLWQAGFIVAPDEQGLVKTIRRYSPNSGTRSQLENPFFRICRNAKSHQVAPC